MKRLVRLSVLILGISCLATLQAEAKRFRLPVRIPTGETVVMVRQLPDIEALHRTDGKYVDLGYHFTTTGGEWVGYVGSSDSYVPLDEAKLQALMSLSGLSKLPPVPARPAGSALGGGFYMLMLGVGAVVLLGKALSFMKRGAGSVLGAAGAVAAVQRRRIEDEDAAPADMAKFDRLIANAARQHVNPASVQRMSPNQGQSTFGKRR
jgi:hypothetical protein